MSDLVSVIVVVAAIVGFIRGFTDKRPSFWRGFGEGLAGKGECHADTYLFSMTTTPAWYRHANQE